MSKAKITWLAAAALLAAAVIIILVVLQSKSSRESTAETITVNYSELPDEALAPLESVLKDFESLNTLIRIESVDGESTADVKFTRNLADTPGSVSRPWRSIGWRLFSRLPTLANLEGEWRQQLILPLTGNDIGLTDFLAMLKRGREAGLVPIGLIDSDDARSAWQSYTTRLEVDFGDLAIYYPGLPEALDDLAKGRIMFLFWDDRLLPLIPQQVRPQHRGFTFPGSRDGDNAFFIGRLYWIALSAEAALREEANALVKYVTSPGVAQSLQRELVGEFFSWTDDSVDEILPAVAGPGELVEP